MEERNSPRPVTSDTPAGPSTPQPGMHINPVSPPRPDPIRPVPEEPTPPEFRPSKKPRGYAWRGFWSMLQLVIGAVALAFLINQFIFQSYQVFGQSMVPTLHEGDRLIINKLGKSWSSLLRNDYVPKRGDIVVFHNPNDTEVQLVKRVVGLPGDRVVVSGGEIAVYVPGSQTPIIFDEFLDLEVGPAIGKVDLVVPEGEIFVVGDNRSPGGSLDSRNELGTVPINEVVGDLVLRIFPLNDARTF